jgi:cell division protein ZapB
MSDKQLHAVEAKLDQLILLLTRLDRENRELKERESNWLHERTRLIEKNELARSRVEAMIGRLKNLETES